jgi:hypothetical protein
MGYVGMAVVLLVVVGALQWIAMKSPSKRERD